MTWRAFFKPATILFLALWLVLLVGGRSRFFHDPGTFWHTIVGDRILKVGFFDTDPFTFTFAERPWIPHQWLGEVVMSLVHAIGGFDALLLLAATVLAALFAWLGARLMRGGLHPTLAFALTALAVAASSGHFHVRPHLATIVGFAITIAMLSDYEAGRIPLRRLVWLIPIYLVWSNMHGGVLGGLATIAIAIAGWTLARAIGWPSPLRTYRQALMLAAILAASAASALVNPYGIRLPEAWLTIYRMQSLPRLIKEHSPLDLDDRNAWMILLFGGVYLGLLVSTLPTRPRVVWLVPALWLVLTCLRVRHAPLFACGALVAIGDLFPFTALARRWQARGSDLFTPPDHEVPRTIGARLASLALPVVCVLTALGLQAARVEAPVLGRGWAQLDREIWPVELLGEIRSSRLEGARVFCEYAWGGFLIYHAPGCKVFVDDRCELYGDAWLAEFIRAPAWSVAQWEADYGPFDFALVAAHPEPGFRDYFNLSPDWVLVKSTAAAAWYQRRR